MQESLDVLELKLNKRSYLSDFAGKTVEQVALLAKDGNPEAREEICLRFSDAMNNKAKKLSVTYKSLDEDLSTYTGLIFDSLMDTIKCFDPAKGHFVNIWRTILKWKKLQLVSKLCASHKPGRKNTNHPFDDEEDTDSYIDYYAAQNEDNNKETEYEVESAEIILSFIKHHYSLENYKIICMWMMSFSLKEISKKLNIPLKKVNSNLYTLINSVRKAVSDGILCLN